MTDLGRITRLTPEDAAALHLRGVAGDRGAVADFILYGSWLRINRARAGAKAKLGALRFLIENTRVDVEYLYPPKLTADPASHPMDEVLDV